MNRNHVVRLSLGTCLIAAACCPAVLFADDDAAVTHQVTGLFCKERVADLQQVCQTLPGIELKGVDYERSEARFVYDAQKAFPGAKPEQIVERFDNLLRNASRHTFGIKPRCTELDQLERIDIGVEGLDCKGCSFGAYDAVYRLDGVEHATASFKEGLVCVWIHPGKINREKLTEALTKRGVTLAEKKGEKGEK